MAIAQNESKKPILATMSQSLVSVAFIVFFHEFLRLILASVIKSEYILFSG